VKRPKQVKPVHDLWSDEDTEKFEAAAAGDRLHPVITLQCLGLRPEEVCGLKWRAGSYLAHQGVSPDERRYTCRTTAR
jgi:integrase